MKTINKIFWQTALSLAFVACQNEDIVTENAEQGAEVYTLQGIMGGSNQSRAQVELNRTEVENERFIWNEEDKITLYDINAETTSGNTFQIAESYNEDPRIGNPSGEALFTTKTPLIAGNQVTAVYPAQTVEPTDGTITLSLPSEYTIENMTEAWKEYMRTNMFMYASAVEVNSSTSLQFKHLCAMARITYTNGTEQDIRITKCELEGDGEYFATSVKLNVKEGNLSEKTTAKTAGISFSNRFISPGMAEEIYLLFFPGAGFNEGGKLTVKIYTEGNETPSTVDILVDEIQGNNSDAQSFEAGKRYWFRLMQTPNGLIRKSNVADGTISNTQLINIIQSQLGNEAILTKDENGFIIVEESKDALSQVKTIEGCFDNLEDVKYLPNLETLICWENQEHPLTKLDVNKNPKLKTLRCNGSALASLDVSNNPELIYLNCHDNKLTSLDLSKNTKLQVLNCGNNQITSLNLSNHPELVSLNCYGNKLTVLDVSKSTKLENLNCSNNPITSLTLGNHPELVSLSCNNNKLTGLDVSKFTKLEELNCSRNQLTSLDVSNNAALNSLSCYNNGLTSLNLSQNTKLTFLDCQVNNLQSLDVTRLTELRSLYCSNNTQLATLDISRNMSLTDLDYSYTSIPSLDVSKHTALIYLACSGEKTTSLDISKNIELETLRCENSSLTSLDISKNVNLETLSCSYSRIQKLDITNNPNIQNLQCGGQRNGNSEINMNLILTADQKALWESSWVNTWGNTNVTLAVKE